MIGLTATISSSSPKSTSSTASSSSSGSEGKKGEGKIEPLPFVGTESSPLLSSSALISSSSSMKEGKEERKIGSVREDVLLELEPVDDSGYPPEEQLCRAARRGDMRRIEALLRRGIKPGKALFAAAAKAKNNWVFEQLLAVSPDLRQKQNGYSIAEYVALFSPWSTAEKRAALEALAKQGQLLPRIHWAACLGEAEEVDREIACGQLAVKDGRGNTTTLYVSANGHLSLLRGLYRKGARVTEANRRGMTALLRAASQGHLSVVQWLLREGGAQVMEANKDGDTALLSAAMWGHLPVVQWLLREGGARVTEADKDGDTALLWAAREGHLSVVQWLLRESGARVTEADKHGFTALLLAVMRGHLPVMQCLLFEYGAPHDKEFLDYIKGKPYDGLRRYLALINSLKKPVFPLQVEALKAVLGYTGKNKAFLTEQTINFLLKQDCELLLAYPEWREFRLFKELWNNKWYRHTHRKTEGLVFVLSGVYWNPSKVSLCLRYLSILPLEGLFLAKNRWSTAESWNIFLRDLAALPLVRLDLTDNQLWDEQLRQLAVVLIKSNRTLTHCILDRNHLSYRGFRALLKTLAPHPTLINLSIRENRIWEKDKTELDRTIGSVLRDEKCHLQTVDVSGNYLISRGNSRTRLEALNQLLRHTGLTAGEFAQANWVEQKESPRGGFTVLRLEVNKAAHDFEVPLTLMDSLLNYGHEEKLDSHQDRFNDLRSGVADTLSQRSELKSVRLRDLAAENRKEQKNRCKELLFFHRDAPLKSYLKRHSRLRSVKLIESAGLLLPGITLTPQMWKVYFAARKGAVSQEHAVLVWEGLYSYGQRIVQAAELRAVRGEGIFARKQIIIQDYGFDLMRAKSFQEKFHMVTFSVSKKQVKAMMIKIEEEKEGKKLPPWIFKEILSSGSTLSSDYQQKIAMNCQKWALEKIECCLGVAEGILQTHQNVRPSVTAIKLQKLSLAERTGNMEEKAGSSSIATLRRT